MDQVWSAAGTAFDLLLVVVGFSLIVFVHELGHFLAARWAGTRVLAFAVGFGTAAVSYRKGLGWRRGSSEQEYLALLRRAGDGAAGVSPTEYRLNWLPFGGYVKMLGQEDLDPAAVSDAPDSYQNTPVGKRLVIISAGVAMNIIAAAVLFVLVFMVGLRTEPARIGAVAPGSPAAKAPGRTASGQAVEPGLRTGDEILAINGRAPNSFNDLVLASAMARKGAVIELRVQRAGLAEPLAFSVTPEEDPVSRLQMVGVEPPRSPRLFGPEDRVNEFTLQAALARAGLAEVEPGMTLVRIGDERNILAAQQLFDAVRDSAGRPFEVEFASRPAGPGLTPRTVTAVIDPKPAWLSDSVLQAPGEVAVVEHVLGLVPVMTVAPDQDGHNAPAHAKGLRDGDIFLRLGTIEFPGIAQGRAEIHRYRGMTIPVIVLREEDDGTRIPVALNVRVTRQGHIGFLVGHTGDTSTMLARPLGEVMGPAGAPRTTAAARLTMLPGSRVLRVGGTMVATFPELLEALRDATAPRDGEFRDTTVRLLIELPLPVQPGADSPPRETVAWTIPADDARRLHDAGWTTDLSLGLFRPEEFLLRAGGPAHAVLMGLRETHRVMLMTYLTLARLFEGTVRVEHLKGPVGIAQLGTRVADRGIIWLLFFMALISVNLAVVNFLPLPIVDGGQFLFLLYELVRGRPVSPSFQAAATALGLILIGAVFLIVTFNDIANLFG